MSSFSAHWSIGQLKVPCGSMWSWRTCWPSDSMVGTDTSHCWPGISQRHCIGSFVPVSAIWFEKSFPKAAAWPKEKEVHGQELSRHVGESVHSKLVHGSKASQIWDPSHERISHEGTSHPGGQKPMEQPPSQDCELQSPMHDPVSWLNIAVIRPFWPCKLSSPVVLTRLAEAYEGVLEVARDEDGFSGLVVVAFRLWKDAGRGGGGMSAEKFLWSPLMIDQEVRLEYLVEKSMWHSLERRHPDQFYAVIGKAVRDIHLHIQICLLDCWKPSGEAVGVGEVTSAESSKASIEIGSVQ